MGDYTVVVSARAEKHLIDIIESDYGHYSRAEQLAYVDEIERAFRSLDHWPKRYAAVTIRGREYRRVNH